MPPTLTEFKKLQRTQTQDDRTINRALLEVAAVHASELTGHPAWDLFLRQLQAMLNQAEAEAATWTERCVNAVKEDDMRFAQRSATSYQGQAQLLRAIMQLPQAILTEHTNTAHPSAGADPPQAV